MTRPLALDLFCGAGGASMGLHRAGFDVVGVDIERQPRYPFAFIQGDALDPPLDLARFDLIWASPPCQAYMRSGTVDKRNRPKLIDNTRRLLTSSGVPWVIENVPGAPLRGDLVLCGSMFGCAIQRHRWFESSGWLGPWVPATCNHGNRITGVYGHAHGKGGAWRNGKRPMLPGDAATWSRAMGIDWMTPAEMTLAVPPAYALHIGRQAIQHRNRAELEAAA